MSERAQHNFDEAMKEGELNYRSGSSFLLGAGGSGKTHTLYAILKEKPPLVRQSTECVKNPVRAVAQCKIGVHKEKTAGQTFFNRITDQQYSDMLCESAKKSHTRERVSIPQSRIKLPPQLQSIFHYLQINKPVPQNLLVVVRG